MTSTQVKLVNNPDTPGFFRNGNSFLRVGFFVCVFFLSKLFITGSVAWVGITDEEEYLSVLLGFLVVF